MKTAVVYYSLEGNTRWAAEKIAARIGADLIELVPFREYPRKGLAKFLHGGKAATFEEKPVLKHYEFDAEKYDRVIIGCPVWAGKCAAPINTFLEDQKSILKALGGNNIGILLCQSGRGAEKVLERYAKILEVPAFHKTLILIDPLNRPNADNDAAIEVFCSAF